MFIKVGIERRASSNRIKLQYKLNKDSIFFHTCRFEKTKKNKTQCSEYIQFFFLNDM
jgi:hypothetical protein